MKSVTSTTLLEGLRDGGNTIAWRRFIDRYQPMVVSYARKQGLSDCDAEDIGQETMMAFIKSYGKGGYDPNKGRLRNWLFRIAHHKVVDVIRRRVRENVVSPRSAGTSILQTIPSRDSAQKKWDREWEHFVLRACLEEVAKQVQQKTYQAFELVVLQQWPVDEVAEHLGMSENAVYIAKNRVVSHARKFLPRVEESW